MTNDRGVVTHGSELKLLFGPVAAEEELEFANTMLDFYLSFITDLNPGGEHWFLPEAEAFPNCGFPRPTDAWAPFTTESKQILWLQRDNTTMIPDGKLRNPPCYLEIIPHSAVFRLLGGPGGPRQLR